MKPLVYFQLLDSSLRYLAVHAKNHSVADWGEIVFDTNILAERQIANRALLETRLDALVREKKWRGAKAHVLIMDDFVVIKEETVPQQLKPDEIRSYLSLQMNSTIRIPFENPVFEFELLEQRENETKLVLVAYPGEFIEEYKKILLSARLKPEVADVSSLSLYRLADEQGLISKDKGGHNLILQLDPYSMNMSMFNQDQPTFTRDSYSDVVAEMWAQSKNGEWQWKYSDSEKDMILNEQFDELDRFLSFYSNSFLRDSDQISQFILTGSYPHLDEARNMLTQRFNLEPQLLTLPQDLAQSYATLYGLSLKKKSKPQKREKTPKQPKDKKLKKEKNPKKDKPPKREKKPKKDMNPEINKNPGIDRNPGADKNPGIDKNPETDKRPEIKVQEGVAND